MRTLLERWNNFIRGDRDGGCDSFFPKVARKAKGGPWQRWWTYLRRRHLQLGRASFPVNSLQPGMQMLDSNAVKPAQKLWTLKMPWLTKLLLTTGSSVNGWPPSLPLFPFYSSSTLKLLAGLPSTNATPSPFSSTNTVPDPFPLGFSWACQILPYPSFSENSLQPFSSAGQTLLNSISCLQSLDQSGSGARRLRRSKQKKARLASHFGIPPFLPRATSLPWGGGLNRNDP